MIKIIQYFGRFQQMQGGFVSLPSWARLIVFVFSLPAFAIGALAIVLFGVSLLALLLLTVPAYRILSAITAPRASKEPSGDPMQAAVFDASGAESQTIPTGRRQIEVKIVQ